MHAHRGLGFAPAALAIAPAAGPAAPFVIAGGLVASLLPLVKLRIGAGRTEADLITPVQNKIGEILAAVDPQIKTAGVARLVQLLDELQEMARFFVNFVGGEQFVDGRASVQALNTIMPQLDGTGEYTWPDLRGRPVATDKWGNLVAGGRVGHIQRRIVELGGRIEPPQLTVGGYLPTLTTVQQGEAYLPQPGLSSLFSPPPPAGYAGEALPARSSSMPLMLAAAAGVGVLLLFGGRK